MCARATLGAVRTRLMPGAVPTTALPGEQGACQRRLRGVPQAVGGNISAAVGGNFSHLSGFAAQIMCRLCVGHEMCARATLGAVRTRLMPGAVPTTALPGEQGAPGERSSSSGRTPTQEVFYQMSCGVSGRLLRGVGEGGRGVYARACERIFTPTIRTFQ